jgi:hypothetical protein
VRKGTRTVLSRHNSLRTSTTHWPRPPTGHGRASADRRPDPEGAPRRRTAHARQLAARLSTKGRTARIATNGRRISAVLRQPVHPHYRLPRRHPGLVPATNVARAAVSHGSETVVVIGICSAMLASPPMCRCIEAARRRDGMANKAPAGGGERERLTGRQESVSLAQLRSEPTWENGG